MKRQTYCNLSLKSFFAYWPTLPVLLVLPFFTAGQCPNDNVFEFDGQRPPCVNFDSVLIGGGTYATFTVDIGRSYTFSTCGSPFNTTLTGYDANGNLIFFNDDNGPECSTDRASVTWTANFTGTIRLLVDSFPCAPFTLTSAVLHYRQNLQITSSDSAMCAGETRALSGLPAGGVFSGNGVVSGVFTAPDINGTVTITYSNGQCAATQNIQVNKNPIVTILNASGSSFCEDDTVELAANAIAGSGIITSYRWQRNGIDFGTDTPVIRTNLDSTYTVEVENSNGCSTLSAPVTLTKLANPIVTLTGLNPDYCINDPGSVLSGTPVGGTFSGPGVGAGVFVPYHAGVGVHTVVYHYTAPNGCDAADSLTTVVNDIPVINFTPLPVVCLSSDSVLLQATPAGGTFSGTGVVDNAFYPAVAGVGGPYTITYTFTDTIGCQNTSSASQSVFVRPAPTATFSNLGTKYCVDAPSVTLAGSPPGGVFSGPGVSGNQFSPALAGPGTHAITYTYTDSSGCKDDHTVSTTVHALPNVSVTGLNASYCVDAPAVPMSGNPQGGTFSGPGLVANAFNPALAGVGGPYLIIYTYIDNNGCRSSDTLQVSVTDIPQLTLQGLDSVYCVDASPVLITPDPPGGQLSGSGIAGNIFTPAAAGVGTHLIVYIYSDPGCTAALQTFVRVNHCPVNVQNMGEPHIWIYPNPTSGKLTIHTGNDRLHTLALFNLFGQQIPVEVSEPASGLLTLDLSSAEKGVYYLQLVKSDRSTVVRKIVVQ
ncbi:MAG: hypothetical protein KatS3mg031_1687 [Chitinophagales bacterium]|nr:MAG: hypothetical protein KatS3mg031_1687 [Chitinophagales bacterium]